jgi:hypothetical protein
MPKIKTKGHVHPTLTGYQFADGKDEPLTPLRAIRKKCLECCCGSQKQVKECHITDCTLWPWRLGRRPSPASVKDTRTASEKEAAESHP